MRLRRPDPHTLAGAYALDALSETDRAAFERPLGACDSCRHEASSLREAAGHLAEATAVVPPPRLREQVLAEAARTRQQPPPVTEAQNAPRSWLGFTRPAAPRLAVAVAGPSPAAASRRLAASWRHASQACMCRSKVTRSAGLRASRA